MKKQKIKIFVIGELFYEYEIFSINLLDFEKVEFLNAVNLEDATDVFFRNNNIDIIIFLKSAFEYFEYLEDDEGYGSQALEEDIKRLQEYIDNVDIQKIINENKELINESIDIVLSGDIKLNEGQIKYTLPRFIGFLRSLGFSGIILASTNVSDIANKFLRAGCSNILPQIHMVDSIINKMYLQKNQNS